jgi:hypothetical protein
MSSSFRFSLSFFVFVPLVLVGCASREKTNTTEELKKQDETVDTFEKGNELMDKEDYAAAAKIFDRLIVNDPASTLDAVILFNAGLSHLMNKDCQKAEDRLRRVVRFAKKDMKGLLLRSKLRLSDALICLGKTKEAMIVQLEIFRDRKDLPLELGEAELPAKIAAGYARNGNRKMADRYFQMAEKGLRRVQGPIFARTLFFMGDTSQSLQSVKTFEDFLGVLRTQQKYLLKAVESEVEPWAEKSGDQILAAYRKSWDFVQQKPATPDAMSRREMKEKNAQRMQQVLLSIKELRDLRRLDRKSPPDVVDLFRGLAIEETKIRNFMVSEVPGSELSAEAERLQAPRREGRVKSGVTDLEKKAQRK